PVVVTVSPDPAMAAQQAEALRAWRSCRRVVRLHDADTTRGALLLEDLCPGTPLREGWAMHEVLPLLAELMTAPLPRRRPALAPVRARVDVMFELARRRLD